MRYALIEMVQRILGSMDSDEVNSIADTTEALEVANIIKECYFEIIAEHSSKNEENLFHLDAGTDNTKPTLMFLPESAANVHRLEYNISETLSDVNLRKLKFYPVLEFLQIINNLDATQSWVGLQTIALDGQNFEIKYRNDSFPTYWTSPDDHTILLDSFQSEVENTATSIRTYAYGLKVPTFSLEDDYVPNLDPRQFALLLNKAKAQAFIEIKQTQNDKAERNQRRFNALAYKSDDSTDMRPAIYKQHGFGRKTLRR